MVHEPLNAYIEQATIKGMGRTAGAILHMLETSQPGMKEHLMELMILEPNVIWRRKPQINNIEKEEQQIFGHLTEELQREPSPLLTDEKGDAFLPRLGTFHTGIPLTEMTIQLNEEGNGYELRHNGNLFECPVTAAQFLEGTEIEVITGMDPLLRSIFRDAETGELKPVEIVTNPLETEPLQEAWNLIEKHYPWYAQLMEFVANRIVVFESETVRSFASLYSHGVSYINAAFGKVADKMLYYVEELVHQVGHNIFFTVTFEPFDYFTVDAWEGKICDYTEFKDDRRQLISVYHGLCTLTYCSDFFEILLDHPEEFTAAQYHEVQGRFADNIYRMERNLAKINLPDVMTEKGRNLYKLFADYYEKAIAKRADVLAKYDTSNQPYYLKKGTPSIFDYNVFLATNPL